MDYSPPLQTANELYESISQLEKEIGSGRFPGVGKGMIVDESTRKLARIAREKDFFLYEAWTPRPSSPIMPNNVLMQAGENCKGLLGYLADKRTILSQNYSSDGDIAISDQSSKALLKAANAMENKGCKVVGMDNRLLLQEQRKAEAENSPIRAMSYAQHREEEFFLPAIKSHQSEDIVALLQKKHLLSPFFRNLLKKERIPYVIFLEKP